MPTPNRNPICLLVALLWLVAPASVSAQQNYLPGVHPGKPTVEIQGDDIVVRNEILSARWSLAGKHLSKASFSSTLSASSIALSESSFLIVFRDGRILTSASMPVTGAPRIEDFAC